MTAATLIRGGHLVTMNETREVLRADLRMDRGKIVEIGVGLAPSKGGEVVDASDCFVIPGIIQAHTHLCQTLFRGLAMILSCSPGSRRKSGPWKMPMMKRAFARRLRWVCSKCNVGTTAILDMGSVRLHHVVFEEAQRSGMRYWGGNCLMDKKSTSGPLFRDTQQTLAYCTELVEEWHQRTPLIQYAIAPASPSRAAKKCSKVP